ncbi:MAG TPA: thiamine pyrophosphate-binding protein [Nonomuraea sp.]|nr:thiamine pyrophosphate-binding protein [Nonomuraea sp.]
MAAALADLGVRTVFGIGISDSGPLADALDRHRVRLITATRADSIAAMTIAHAHVSGHVSGAADGSVDSNVTILLASDSAVATALPSIVTAVTSRTPLLVLAPLTGAHTANTALAQTALLRQAGALIRDLTDLRQARTVLTKAARTAQTHHRPVLLRIATSQYPTLPAPTSTTTGTSSREVPALDLLAVPAAEPAAVEELAALLGRALRPVFIVGRGATHAAATIESLADQAGALLATSVGAHGVFVGNPWHIGIAGVLATPDMADLLAAADAVVSWGCTLDDWVTGHGSLIAAEAELAQIDINPAALGLHRSIHLGVAGDAGRTAQALQQVLAGHHTRYRTEPVRERIAAQASWHDVGYQPTLETADRIDPRTVTLVLDTILPTERTLIVEPNTILGYPISYLRVPDADSFWLAPPGLGLASGIGAALARPDRSAVVALDTDTALASAADLEAAARLRLPLLVIVYDEDDPVDADTHEPEAAGLAVRLARFATAGHGCRSAVIRRPADLTEVTSWAARPDSQPLLLHVHVTRNAWLLAEQAGTPLPGQAC